MDDKPITETQLHILATIEDGKRYLAFGYPLNRRLTGFWSALHYAVSMIDLCQRRLIRVAESNTREAWVEITDAGRRRLEELRTAAAGAH